LRIFNCGQLDNEAAFEGTLTLFDDALNLSGTQQQIAMQAPFAAAVLSTGSVSFGLGPVGYSGGNTSVTLANPGTAPLVLANAQLTGPAAGDFQVDVHECLGAQGMPPQSGCLRRRAPESQH
jgi:hypothetical protein